MLNDRGLFLENDGNICPSPFIFFHFAFMHFFLKASIMHTGKTKMWVIRVKLMKYTNTDDL